jgi:hypothetical protein
MKHIIGILLTVFTLSAFAQKQKQEASIVQFTGIVHNADSAKIIVPYVSITNVSGHKQVNPTNYKGYFSFVAHERDTIKFTCVGYSPETVVIPANVTSKSYTLQVMLKPRIINLPTFRVFPWATTEEFTKDFLSMKIADDELEIARKNLNLSSILSLERTLPRDGTESNAQDMTNSIINSHSITNPLLNPFAWGALIRQISEGDKSRASDN